jgi:Uma2 family endonuclease
VFWISPENTRCTLVDGKYWHGAPDLVVEVLSSSTARRDRKEKLQLYQQYGVREYWLVDPDGEYVEVYRQEGEQLVKHGIWGPGESFTSPALSNRAVEISALFEH